MKWKDKLYRSDPQKRGFAVSYGHLILASQWLTPGTTVDLVCSGGNFKVTVGLIYKSKELAGEA